MNRPTIHQTALVAITLLTTSAIAQKPMLPDTIAGQRASALIAALNSGDENDLRTFETTHTAASAARGRRSIDDRIAAWKNRQQEWGQLTLKNTLHHGPHDILLVVEPQRDDGWVHITLALEDQAPHGLERTRIEGPFDPDASAAANKLVSPKSRKRVINRIADELARGYVFEDVGNKMADTLRKRLAAGAYDELAYSYPLAQQLTDELRAICNDKHLRVMPRIPMTRAGQRIQRTTDLAPKPEANYGFTRVEVLPGNIGYIKLNGFEGSPDARPTAAAAMAFVANTDALIFDLTINGGGSPAMINFLSGHLFDEPVHLNTFHRRAAGMVRDTYSEDIPHENRYGHDKPVYVLTSAYTFSAAEEFTYNLKHLRRATIVGETSGGGAHPVNFLTVSKYLILKIPDGRAVNPITKTNWEGVGVIPHHEVPADQARDTAHNLAISAIESKNTMSQ